MMSGSTFREYYGLNTEQDVAEFANAMGMPIGQEHYGLVAGLINNGGNATIDNNMLQLLYCDCNAQVLTDGWGGDPIEMVDGANVLKGWNSIIDVEIELNLTGVGQSGPWEGLIPVWGSGRDALDDFHYGDLGRGALNTAIAVSDIFLIRSVGMGILRGGLKLLGSHSWKATRSYYLRKGFAEPGKPLHHWLIQRNGPFGKYVPDGIKNQMWNLKSFENQISHMTLGHGQTYLGHRGASFLGQAWFGTPTWFKAASFSTLGRTVN